MKRQIWIGAIALGLAGAAPAVAAVSGFYDSLSALEVVLKTEGLANALRQQPVVSIDVNPMSDTDEIWSVRSLDCAADVVVLRTPPNGPGVNTYTASLDGVVCN